MACWEGSRRRSRQGAEKPREAAPGAQSFIRIPGWSALGFPD